MAMATDKQIARLREWGFPGNPSSLSTDEARDTIFAIHRWMAAHRKQYQVWDDYCGEFVDEDAALGDFWREQGEQLQRNISHVRRVRRCRPTQSRANKRWVQAVSITTAIRDGLGYHTPNGDYRLTGLTLDEWYISIWADTQQELSQRIARVQAVLTGPDPIGGSKQIWEEESVAIDKTRLLVEKWTIMFGMARRVATEQEYDAIVTTIRHEMLANKWRTIDMDKWVAAMSDEYMYGMPMWKRMLASTKQMATIE